MMTFNYDGVRGVEEPQQLDDQTVCFRVRIQMGERDMVGHFYMSRSLPTHYPQDWPRLAARAAREAISSEL